MTDTNTEPEPRAEPEPRDQLDASASGTPRKSGRGTQAYRHLRDLIVRGQLAPGTRLVETEIAARLGISRTPVRSALQRLVHEGYVQDPGTGRQSRPLVAAVTRADARELLHIVGEIEGLAAWRAARRHDRTRLVEHLNTLNADFLAEARREKPSRERIFRLDLRFHRAYVDGGAGPRLLALHDAIKPQAERYTRIYVSALVDQIPVSYDEHQVTVDAIAAGDSAAAQSSVQTNWRNAADRLSGVIDQTGEIGRW